MRRERLGYPRHQARAVLASILLLLASLAASAAQAQDEPPLLAPLVAEGTLPPLAERLPRIPRRDLPDWQGWEPGRYGGELVTLTRGGRDARDLFLLGYTRLVVWDEDLALQPDILESVGVEGGRRFTLRLRPGHRWSDGVAFTTEDFRFWWEDVALNPELSPSGPPAAMLVEGVAPVVEILSETEVRYSWPQPNNRFLPALAGSDAMLIYRPAHVLEAYHPGHADRASLNAQASAAGLSGWSALFERRDRLFEMDDPSLPTLQPWRLTAQSGSERWLAERNPYFHRVDGAGRQLPYLDRVVIDRTQAGLIAAKAMAGETDLQARGLSFRDAALLKEAEAKGIIKLLLWPIGRGAQLALYPNLNAADPAWRHLLRAADFRRALSLAIDREEIRQVIYQGFGRTGNNSLLPGSPLYDPVLRGAFAVHDPSTAGELLDGLGLSRGDDGWRNFPDGSDLVLVIETGDTDPAETDVLLLAGDHLAQVGIEALVRPTGRQNFRNRVQSGQAVMTLFYGLANGLATPDSSPDELAPTSDRQNNWPAWGLHFESGGRRGRAPDMASARRLLELFGEWRGAESGEAKTAAWRRMLEIHADQVLSIGLIADIPQPVAIDPALRNLPGSASYLYEPGAYFGRYRPDTWWFAAD